MNTQMPKTSPENYREINYFLCLHFQTPPTPAETIYKTTRFTFSEEKHNMVWDEFHTSEV